MKTSHWFLIAFLIGLATTGYADSRDEQVDNKLNNPDKLQYETISIEEIYDIVVRQALTDYTIDGGGSGYSNDIQPITVGVASDTPTTTGGGSGNNGTGTGNGTGNSGGHGNNGGAHCQGHC